LRKLGILFLIVFFVSCNVNTGEIKKNAKMYAAENLKLRESEDLSSAVITVMKTGTSICVLETGNDDEIDGESGKWLYVKVLTGKDVSGNIIEAGCKGWCYSAYLSDKPITLDFENSDDPYYWTNEIQKERYDSLFREKNLKEVLNFRNFIESLAAYHHKEPVYEYNPLLLCFEKYKDLLPFFLKNRPDLFITRNASSGDYSEAPIVYVLKNCSLNELKFFFDNKINWEQPEEKLFGTRNAGGPRFGLGGNILLYAKNKETLDYLISQGVKTEDKAPNFFYYFRHSVVSVYEAPGLSSNKIDEIPDSVEFTPVSVLMYCPDNYEWMKIEYDGRQGWISTYDFDYNTGI